MATIFDKDILIFAISQIIAKINLGEEPSQIIQFSAYDLLVSINRGTGGRTYERLKTSFQRLKGTTITTCIITGGKEETEGFSLIDNWKIIRETPKGRMEGLEIKLSNWLYNAILAKEVLNLSPDYFRLSKPLEKRIYELCRKHCGHQKVWSIGLEKLHKKTGTKDTIRNFRGVIKEIIESDNLPEYKITFDKDKKDKLIVRPRIAVVNEPKTDHKPRLKPQTYENASKILRPHGMDKYTVEAEWLQWIEGKESPNNPDGAFIGFCKMQVAHLLK